MLTLVLIFPSFLGRRFSEAFDFSDAIENVTVWLSGLIFKVKYFKTEKPNIPSNSVENVLSLTIPISDCRIENGPITT